MLDPGGNKVKAKISESKQIFAVFFQLNSEI